MSTKKVDGSQPTWLAGPQEQAIFPNGYKNTQTISNQYDARHRALVAWYLMKDNGDLLLADDDDMKIVERNSDRWKYLTALASEYLGSRGFFRPPYEPYERNVAGFAETVRDVDVTPNHLGVPTDATTEDTTDCPVAPVVQLDDYRPKAQIPGPRPASEAELAAPLANA